MICSSTFWTAAETAIEATTRRARIGRVFQERFLGRSVNEESETREHRNEETTAVTPMACSIQLSAIS